MTAQTPDTFLFKGDEYSLIGKSGGDLFTLEDFGIEPVMLHTACYRGYFAKYELKQDLLYLTELTVLDRNAYYPIIGEMHPIIYEGGGPATYQGLSVDIPFSGKIRLAKGFIDEYYIHMGFQKPTAYKTVLDVTLDKGRMVGIDDRSKEMKKKRGDFKKRYESGEMVETIAEAFSLDMDLE